MEYPIAQTVAFDRRGVKLLVLREKFELYPLETLLLRAKYPGIILKRFLVLLGVLEQLRLSLIETTILREQVLQAIKLSARHILDSVTQEGLLVGLHKFSVQPDILLRL